MPLKLEDRLNELDNGTVDITDDDLSEDVNEDEQEKEEEEQPKEKNKKKVVKNKVNKQKSKYSFDNPEYDLCDVDKHIMNVYKSEEDEEEEEEEYEKPKKKVRIKKKVDLIHYKKLKKVLSSYESNVKSDLRDFAFNMRKFLKSFDKNDLIDDDIEDIIDYHNELKEKFLDNLHYLAQNLADEHKAELPEYLYKHITRFFDKEKEKITNFVN